MDHLAEILSAPLTRLGQVARAHPDRSALQILRPTGAERWSYGRLDAAIGGTATGLLRSGLLRSGLAAGDRVAVTTGDVPETPVAVLGALAAGLVPVLCREPHLSVKAVIGAADLSLADLRGFATLPPTTSPTPPDKAFAALDHWRAHAGIGPGDRLLHVGAFDDPLTLTAGLLAPWTAEATALIPAPGVAAEALPLLLRRFDATVLGAPAPVLLRILAAHPKPALPRLRHAVCLGPAPETLRRDWHAATGTPLLDAGPLPVPAP
ncbi:AMP-binding protein [Paenirhodobacter populi]|nr:AMP-binding protein [Sinirhodobacter populi]